MWPQYQKLHSRELRLQAYSIAAYRLTDWLRLQELVSSSTADAVCCLVIHTRVWDGKSL